MNRSPETVESHSSGGERTIGFGRCMEELEGV